MARRSKSCRGPPACCAWALDGRGGFAVWGIDFAHDPLRAHFENTANLILLTIPQLHVDGRWVRTLRPFRLNMLRKTRLKEDRVEHHPSSPGAAEHTAAWRSPWHDGPVSRRRGHRCMGLCQCLSTCP